MIAIKIKQDKKSKMIELVSQEINGALSKLIPPFNMKADEIKLIKLEHDSHWVTLTYEVLRNVKRSKSEENLSPYREMGLTMQVGRNS
jgi:hypothetical protein